LIAEGFVAVTVGYRLAPDHQFAAGRNDVAAAVAYVRGHARSLGVNPQRLALFGTSAGANLALNVGMRGSRVRAIVGYSAPTALAQLYRTSPTMRSRIISYLGCKPVRCPSRARAAGTLGAVDSTDPPVLLASSADDSIVPYSQQVLMADRLRAANVPTTLIKVAGSYHGGKLKRFVWPRTLDFLHARLD
jgi:acetyl esterase/lipase